MQKQSSTEQKQSPSKDGAKEDRVERSRQDNIPDSGVLTQTPGSPRVPTPEEMDASPGADGQDNRINLDQSDTTEKDRK